VYRSKVEGQLGLSSQEASIRLQKFGFNEIEGKKKKSPIIIFLSQFNDFIIWVLIAATIISELMGEKADAVTIFIIVIMNGVMGFIQEYRTEKSLEALKDLASPTAKVIRDGKLSIIKARELVAGDVIEIEAGDRIPADCMIISGDGLHSDESILTGESVSVEKVTFKGNGQDKHTSLIFMGCSITSGRGKAKVIAVGMNTEMGKIANMLENIDTEMTPLQRKLDGLGKIIVYSCLVICAVVTLFGVIRGYDFTQMFLIGVSLAVAAIPEGLPAIVTVSLAIGVQRMMRRNALVRKLPAVETLGCTNIICSDKTGTLTQNKMTVKKVFTIGRSYTVTGDGYGVDGEIEFNRISVSGREDKNLLQLLECFVMCNNASIPMSRARRGGSDEAAGDPTEIALLVLAAKGGVSSSECNGKYNIIKEYPFDSERKMMSVLCTYKNERYLFVKGAPEIILKRCTEAIDNGVKVEMKKGLMDKAAKANNSMAEEALRVLAGAYKKLEGSSGEADESSLVFLGMAGMIDPPREEVKDSIIECRTAGITPVMITGDHKLTAMAIATQLRMMDKESIVLTGEELESISDSALDKIIPRVRVFARVNPSHKHRIVKCLKKQGKVVAMTGDGVNDAPAIKEADIGIAMGISGTDVTKEASSMILMDDNFSTIVAAVEEGRVIYDNIRKFIRYLLSCNIGEVLTMLIASLLDLPLPLLPIQILLVNLATDGLPAMALCMEPGEKDVMLRRPREKKESIFSDGLWGKIVVRGIMIGLCTVISFTISLILFGGNEALANTVCLCTLVLSQLFHVFECKSERHSVFQVGFFSNMYLVYASLSSTILLLLTVYLPWFQKIFKTQGLNPLQWGIVLVFSGTISLVSSLFWYRGKR
jgi:Ca2+-transporting ATPase